MATYPFSAIVGQEAMKQALLLAAINPRLGGILIRGEKGTAKSTAVRALAALLPELDVVADCAYGCDPDDPSAWCRDCQALARAAEAAGPAAPEGDGTTASGKAVASGLARVTRPTRLVELPVNATEDRVVGTLDLERALRHGEQRFAPGLLAAANRGILYVDEVNLLDDHLVDVLLDAAAMGVATVEREGVSVSHPARFLLVGTMNPEEGDLRPQLLDRFALCVDVEGVRDPRSRVEIVRRFRAYEDDQEGFVRFWADDEAALREQILTARRLLPDVVVPEPLLFAIAELAIELGVDGHRADVVIGKAAATIAAMKGRRQATLDDVSAAAPLALAHRMRRRPFEESRLDATRIESLLVGSAAKQGAELREPGGGQAGPGPACPPPGPPPPDNDAAGASSGSGGAVIAPGVRPDAALGTITHTDGLVRQTAGRRATTKTSTPRGKTIAARTPDGPTSDVAVAATIRAGALRASGRLALAEAVETTAAQAGILPEAQGALRGDGLKTKEGITRLRVEPEDIRAKVRRAKTGAAILFCLDASGSMQAEQRMAAAKGAALALLVDAYQRRDRVGVIAFRGERAELVLPLTRSVELAQTRLADIPTGGATPLSEGLVLAHQVLARELRRDSEVIPWIILLSDGHANVSAGGGLALEEAREAAAALKEANMRLLVVDTSGANGYGYARQIARAAGGEHVRLDDIEAGRLTKLIARSVRSPKTE